MPLFCRTRFALFNRRQAALILALALGLLLWSLWSSLAQEIIPAERVQGNEPTEGDAQFYREVIDQVRQKQNYYDAVRAGLIERDYQPHSMFNWRLPVYAWLLGNMPSLLWGQLLLAGFIFLAIFWLLAVLHCEGNLLQAGLASFLFIGWFGWCFYEDLITFQEFWSGTFIALSVGAYAHERWQVGLIAALAALFFRELALPYCLICLAFAFWDKRRAELAAWLLGFLLVGLFLAWHRQQATLRITETGGQGASGWIQFWGMRLVLLATQMGNMFLIVAPSWLSAVCLPLALLGLAAWPTKTGLRIALTVGVFVAAYTVVGKWPDNGYWGLMFAPFVPLGLAWAPGALHDLFRALRPLPKN